MPFQNAVDLGEQRPPEHRRRGLHPGQDPLVVVLRHVVPEHVRGVPEVWCGRSVERVDGGDARTVAQVDRPLAPLLPLDDPERRLPRHALVPPLDFVRGVALDAVPGLNSRAVIDDRDVGGGGQ